MRMLLALIMLTLLVSPVEAKKRYHCRDALTGKYVSLSYARAHPETTVCEKTRR